ncbi:flavin reductase family protein [Alcaligenaceae bacterium]|nr:flavin reductase family protein [Alcaligenaceae bacterium]
MVFDMVSLSAENRYKLLTATVVPRPIAWVTTCSADGIVNAAAFSFFNAMGNDPPILAIGLLHNPEGGAKDTARNIIATQEFVVNLVPESLASAMNITSAAVAADVNELELANLKEIASLKVAPPRIEGSPVAFECRTFQAIDTGPKQMIVLGEVLAVHIDSQYVLDAERCHIDTSALELIARMHGRGWYARTLDQFEMKRR